MKQVWALGPNKVAQRLLLLAIAWHADDNGMAWPGVPLLAEETTLTDRRVRQILVELEAAAYLTREPRPGRSNVYRVNIPTPEARFRAEARFRVKSPAGAPLKRASPTPEARSRQNHQEPSGEPPTTKAVAAPADAAPPVVGGLTTKITYAEADEDTAEITIELDDTDDDEAQRASVATARRVIANLRAADVADADERGFCVTDDDLYEPGEAWLTVEVPYAERDAWLARVRHWIDPTQPAPPPASGDPITAAGLNDTQRAAFIAWLTTTGSRNPGGLIATLDRKDQLAGRIAEWKATRRPGTSFWDKPVSPSSTAEDPNHTPGATP